jgi:hypothetical protein
MVERLLSSLFLRQVRNVDESTVLGVRTVLGLEMVFGSRMLRSAGARIALLIEVYYFLSADISSQPQVSAADNTSSLQLIPKCLTNCTGSQNV